MTTSPKRAMNSVKQSPPSKTTATDCSLSSAFNDGKTAKCALLSSEQCSESCAHQLKKVRYCLFCPEGYLLDHDQKSLLVGDGSPLLTADPLASLQFTTIEEAVARAKQLFHLIPGLTVRAVLFVYIGDDLGRVVDG